MNQPLVSVLICTYNAEKFIRETLQSVINQSYKNIELLILDNGSTDKTLQLINQLEWGQMKIRIFKQKHNLGPYNGLNILLDEAKGAYIGINDHDDIWYSQKLEKQVSFLEENKKYVGCGSAIINSYEQYDELIYRSQPEKADIAWHTSLVFRNNNYRYDTSVKLGTDFYFIKNILCKNQKLIYNFQEPLVLRRIFQGKQNLSGQWMKKVSFMDIVTLQIGLFDKISLLNRYFLPQQWVEWVLVKIYGNKIPKNYESYAKTLSSMISSLRP